MDNIQTRATLDEHLKGIIDDMVRLSSKVDTAIDKAINAFASCDVELGQQVIAQDTGNPFFTRRRITGTIAHSQTGNTIPRRPLNAIAAYRFLGRMRSITLDGR